MFDDIKLFQNDFDEIFLLAKNMAKSVSLDTSIDREADPYYTFLEVFSALSRMQQIYMESLDKKAMLNLLKIFSVNIKEKSPALYITKPHKKNSIIAKNESFRYNSSYLNSDEKKIINSYLAKSLHVFENSKLKITRDLNEKFIKSQMVFDTDEYFAIDISYDSVDDEIELYFEIENSNRNPFNDFVKENAVNISKIEVSLSSIKDEKIHEIKKLDIISDETMGFQKSGSIILKDLENLLDENGDLFTLKFKEINSLRDIYPKISKVFTNKISLSQKKVLASSLDFHLVCDSNSVLISDYLAKYSDAKLFLKLNDYYLELKGGFKIIWIEDLKKARIDFEDSFIISLKEKHNINTSSLLQFNIIFYADDLKHYKVLGTGDNSSFQEYSIEIDNIIKNSLEIMVRDKDKWFKYKRVDNIYNSDKHSRCYVYNQEENKIVFGDGFYSIPPKHYRDNIIVTNLEKSEFQKGSHNKVLDNLKNIDKNLISLDDISLNVSGSDKRSFEELKEDFKDDEYFGKTIVSSDDYRELILKFPSLIIDDVRVYSKEENTIDIVIKTGFKSKKHSWKKFYRENLLKYIDENKILCTRVRIDFED